MGHSVFGVLSERQQALRKSAVFRKTFLFRWSSSLSKYTHDSNNMEKPEKTSKGEGASGSSASGASKASGKRSAKSLDDEFMREYNIGDDVLVIYHGRWHAAKVRKKEWMAHPEQKGVEVNSYLIHYPGWGQRHDEWVYSDSMMIVNDENKKKAAEENAEHDAQLISEGKKVPKERKQKMGSKVSKLKPATADKKGSQERSIEEPAPVENVAATSAAKPPEKKRGRRPKEPSATPSVAATVPADGPSSKDSVADQEPAAPVAPPVAGPEKTVEKVAEKEESEELTAEHPAAKRARTEQDYIVLKYHYDNADPKQPNKQTKVQDGLVRKTMAAIGIVHDAFDGEKTGEEKREMFVESARLLAFAQAAVQRKLQDEAVLCLSWPPKLLHAMAENYVATVVDGKLMKSITVPEKSVAGILARYKLHIEQSLKDATAEWRNALLAELQSLTENFPKFLPTLLTRMELPQYLDLKKMSKKKDSFLTESYGFVHLVRAVELMMKLYNLDGKRLVGKCGEDLLAIYNCILRFIEEHVLADCDEGDATYFEPDDEYVKKIKFASFEKDKSKQPEDSLHHFHFLSESLLDVVRNTPQEAGETFKLSWRSVQQEGVPMEE